MAFGMNPGSFFIGGQPSDCRCFVSTILHKAKGRYKRVVEPCAGQFVVASIAKNEGYEVIEASDITMYSGILGRVLEDKPLDDMGIVNLETGELETEPSKILFNIKRKELKNGSTNLYGKAVYEDFMAREEEIREELRKELESLKMPGLTYFDMDMFDHIARVKDDPEAIVFLYPPTYTGGYEKFYKAVDELYKWNTPLYRMFSPDPGYIELMEFTKDAKCLVLMYEETEAGCSIGRPLYGRQAGREGMNLYMVSNRPDEVEELIGISCKVKDSGKMEPSKYPLIPNDYLVTKDSKVEVVKLKPENIRYYRKLFTHNFTPSQASSGFGMIVDGYMAGIFGYMDFAMSLGASEDTTFIGFCISAKSVNRLNKLQYMLAVQKKTLAMYHNDLQMANIKKVRTTMITKHHCVMEIRGIMKKILEVPDKRMGYQLLYEGAMQDKDYEQVLQEFVEKEEAWRKQRATRQ